MDMAGTWAKVLNHKDNHPVDKIVAEDKSEEIKFFTERKNFVEQNLIKTNHAYGLKKLTDMSENEFLPSIITPGSINESKEKDEQNAVGMSTNIESPGIVISEKPSKLDREVTNREPSPSRAEIKSEIHELNGEIKILPKTKGLMEKMMNRERKIIFPGEGKKEILEAQLMDPLTTKLEEPIEINEGSNIFPTPIEKGNMIMTGNQNLPTPIDETLMMAANKTMPTLKVRGDLIKMEWMDGSKLSMPMSSTRGRGEPNMRGASKIGSPSRTRGSSRARSRVAGAHGKKFTSVGGLGVHFMSDGQRMRSPSGSEPRMRGVERKIGPTTRGGGRQPGARIISPTMRGGTGPRMISPTMRGGTGPRMISPAMRGVTGPRMISPTMRGVTGPRMISPTMRGGTGPRMISPTKRGGTGPRMISPTKRGVILSPVRGGSGMAGGMKRSLPVLRGRNPSGQGEVRIRDGERMILAAVSKKRRLMERGDEGIDNVNEVGSVDQDVTEIIDNPAFGSSSSPSRFPTPIQHDSSLAFSSNSIGISTPILTKLRNCDVSVSVSHNKTPQLPPGFKFPSSISVTRCSSNNNEQETPGILYNSSSNKRKLSTPQRIYNILSGDNAQNNVTKKKVELELSDPQIEVMKELGLMPF